MRANINGEDQRFSTRHHSSYFHITPSTLFKNQLVTNYGKQLVAYRTSHMMHPSKWSKPKSAMRSTIREIANSFRNLAKFFARWSHAISPSARVPPNTLRINDCDSKETHSLIFSSSMIDPEVERSRMQPARSRSAADRTTSPCRSSSDGIRPAVLRFVESQANARKKEEDEIAARPRQKSAGGDDGRGGSACCNQQSRVGCRPPDDQKNADRLQPSLVE